MLAVCCGISPIACADGPVVTLSHDWSTVLPPQIAIRRLVVDFGQILVWDANNTAHSISRNGVAPADHIGAHLQPWLSNVPQPGSHNVTVLTPHGHITEQFNDIPAAMPVFDGEPVEPQAETAAQIVMVAVPVDRPFEILTKWQSGILSVSLDSRTRLTLADTAPWTPGPILPIGECWIRTLVNVTSDRRLLVLYDGEWNRVRSVELDTPIVLVAADHTHVYGVLQLNQPEFVAYKLSWQAGKAPCKSKRD
jgi:hypothetical protein